TGKAGEYPDDSMVGAPLLSGWYLLVAKGCDHRIITDRVLKTLSRGCRMIACSVEEDVMWRLTTQWENGEEVLRASHSGDRDVHNLTTSGTLPDFFARVHAEALAQQAAEGGADAEVDCVFDVPLELARRITGFRHDGSENVAAQHFEVLIESSPSKPRWRFW